MKTGPVFGCLSRIPWEPLVCHGHWKRLPARTRKTLSRLHHTEPGSDRELEAILAALDHLNARQGERQPYGARA